MPFMRSVFDANTNRSPRHRRGGKVEPGFGPNLIGAVLADGSFVVVDVEDENWHKEASAVPHADIIGEMHRCNRPKDVDHDKWFGQFSGPKGGTYIVKDDCGRMAFGCPAVLAAQLLKLRNEVYSEEIRILANPVENLERELKSHDWYCHMSDAPGVCGAGEAHMRRIKQIAEDVDPNAVRQLWTKYAPQGFACPV